MKTVLASILLLASGALANGCNRVREGQFIFECCQTAHSYSKTPVACITPDEQELACGASTTVFQHGQSTGFKYTCEKLANSKIILKPTGCALSTGQSVNIGQTLIYNSYNYRCSDNGNGNVLFQVDGCVNNGDVVPIGGTCNYCVSHQCQTMRCVENNGHVGLKPIVCIAPDNTQIAVGGSHTIYNGQTGITYTCEETGTTTPTIKATGCVCNGRFATFGSNIIVGNTEYVCTEQGGQVVFKPQTCTAPNGQHILVGETITVYEGQLGFVYNCQDKGLATTAVATGCACKDGQTVGFGGTITYGNAVYSCENNNGVLSINPQGCTDANGQHLPVGTSRTIYNGNFGYTYTCEIHGNTFTVKPTGCSVMGETPVNIGQTIRHGSVTYLCSATGNGGISFKVHGCINNGQVVNIGGTTKSCTGSTCFSMKCTEHNGGVSLQPEGCINSDGTHVAVGSTSNVMQNNFGFVYKCVINGNTIKFTPTGCIVSGGAQAPIGGTVIYKDFNYLCNYSNEVISFAPRDCVSNGKIIPIGSSNKVCNNQQCQIMACISQGHNSIALKTTGCSFGQTFVQVGDQCVWQNQRCFCNPSTAPTCVRM